MSKLIRHYGVDKLNQKSGDYKYFKTICGLKLKEDNPGEKFNRRCKKCSSILKGRLNEK